MDEVIQPFSKKSKKRWVALVILIIALLAGVIIWLNLRPKTLPATDNLSPAPIVPATVAQAVSFPVYYPDPKKLPPGYKLDISSFKVASDQVVIYIVKYGVNKKLVFSVQAKPSDNDIGVFYKNNIPLHDDVLTLVGKAAIGNINNKVFVSLPTYSNSWIIITGPSDINSDQLKQVLQAIVKPD